LPDYFTTFAENFTKSIPAILSAVLILLVSYYGGVLLSRLLYGVLTRQNAEVGVTHLLTRTVKWTVIVFGCIAALQKFYNVTAFLTGLGIVGFTIGFALQNIMQNFVSGVILLVQQPFKVGDTVHITSFDGTILKIGMRTTEMKSLDGRIVFLPNADILAQPIINYTRASTRRIELPIGVAYDSDTDFVHKVILGELKKIKGYLPDPEPQILFHTFAASSIDLNVLFWVDTSITSTFIAKDEALTLIKKAFEKNKVEIPYPIQVQYNRTEKQAAPRRKSK